MHCSKQTSPPEDAFSIPFGTWIAESTDSGATRRMFRTAEAAILDAGASRARPTHKADDDTRQIEVLEITSPGEIARIQADPLEIPLKVRVVDTQKYAHGDGQPGIYMRAPGPHATRASGFLPLTLAISFFLFWPLMGASQPAQFVRLMAFNNSRTFVRAIVTVAIYYTIIYIPLLIIFTVARVVTARYGNRSGSNHACDGCALDHGSPYAMAGWACCGRRFCCGDVDRGQLFTVGLLGHGARHLPAAH